MVIDEFSEKIMETLRRDSKGTRLHMPPNIWLREVGEKLVITLGRRAVGLRSGKSCPYNMHDDCAAFETWAAAIKGSPTFKKKGRFQEVRLELDSLMPPMSTQDDLREFLFANLHFARFLYRALIFKRSYPWFSVSSDIQRSLDLFEGFVEDNKLTNSPPKGPAPSWTGEPGEERVISSEADVKVFFEEHKEMLLEEVGVDAGAELNRKLKASLYLGKVSDDTLVFPIKSSSVDMWALDEDMLHVFEIKHSNIKMGCISEVFFYTNFVYDLIMDDGCFTLNKKKVDFRGYSKLVAAKGKVECVNGYVLADRPHPLLNRNTIRCLNDNERGIYYGGLIYNIDGDLVTIDSI